MAVSTKPSPKTVRWPEDTTCVNIQEDHELQFWAARFHCSREKLKQAVRAVGPQFRDVLRHLDSKRW